MSEKKEEKRVYPTIPREPLRTMPSTLLLMAPGKVGKSAVSAGLTKDFAPGKSVVVTLGAEGSYDNHTVNEINTSLGKFEKLLDDLIKDQPYDFIIYDHLSELNSWAEILGGIYYSSTSMGKSFNIKDPGLPKLGFNKAPQNYWLPKHKEFESIHTLPNGSGYQFSRKEGLRLYHKMAASAKYVIFVGHLKLNRHTINDKGTTVSSEHLDMTNGIRSQICKDVDCMATMNRKKDEGFLVFKTGHADRDAGSRYHYLENKTFKISEKQEDGSIKTFWETIYSDYKFEPLKTK